MVANVGGGLPQGETVYSKLLGPVRVKTLPFPHDVIYSWFCILKPQDGFGFTAWPYSQKDIDISSVCLCPSWRMWHCPTFVPYLNNEGLLKYSPPIYPSICPPFLSLVVSVQYPYNCSQSFHELGPACSEMHIISIKYKLQWIPLLLINYNHGVAPF